MTATIARLRSTLAVQMALDSKRRAARLTELRERAQLTQKALDEKSGVSERTIQRAEDPNDDIELRYSTREKLAKALGVKPADLLAEAEKPKGDTPDLTAALNGDHPQLDRIETQLAALDDKLDEIRRALALSDPDDELPMPEPAAPSRAPAAADTSGRGRNRRRRGA